MAANTTLLIAVAAMAVLLPAGILAVVVYKTRTQGETIRDQAEENARHVRRQEALADEYTAKAHAAQVDVDIKTARARRLRHQAAAATTNGDPADGAALESGHAAS
jgi:hypothetical protein